MRKRKHSAVIGGFPTQRRAERAADELRSAGFEDAQMIVAARVSDLASAGGDLARTDGESGAASLADLIAQVGFSPDQARTYAERFDDKDAVLAVNAARRYEDVVRIMRDFGAEIAGGDPDEVQGYDTPVTTPETLGQRTYREPGEIGAETGEERTYDELHPSYSQRETTAARPAERWEDAEPGRLFGQEVARDERFRGRRWEDVEPELAKEYGRWAGERGYTYDEGTWEWLADTVRAAFTPATAGAKPSDNPRPEQLHRWVRLYPEGADLDPGPARLIEPGEAGDARE